MDLERLRARHRSWLQKNGLLDRPWFVLGSAPDPTIPECISERAALICINNSAATAARAGLPPPTLTVRASHKEWRSVAGCSFPLMLMVTNDTLWMYCKRLVNQHYKKPTTGEVMIGELKMIRKKDRDRICLSQLSSDLNAIGMKHRPSTGIFAVLYAMFLGVPEVILAGISVGKDGYSYGLLPGIQIHRDEDMFAMRRIAEITSSVRTSEPELAEATGLPLYQAEMSPAATAVRITESRLGLPRGNRDR